MPSIKGTSFEQVCPVGGPLGGINVVFDKFGLTKQVSFGNVVQECSQLTVDIAADRRRRCFRSNTTVTYTNDGSADAHNVKIKVLYPKYVVPISSSLPWVARQDSALIFDIGTLKAGERKSFVIADSTICGNEGIRGLSQCVKAIITPKSTCISPNQEWDESSVLLSANFTNQEQTAEFTIINEGAGDMTDSTSYRVFANTSLVKEGKVKLKKGAATTLEIPATLATYRLEADQVPHHPGQSRPAVSLQPSVIPTGVPSMAMPTPIDHFYQDDADAEVDISCLDIIDSYDPNDKQVSPQGITARRYIKENQDLEYLIRFQNTGTDVAYNVIIRDTINEHLDIASLKVGSASHPLTYTVSGKGKPVVTFTFKNINLPDHKTNEPGSHGFVKFTIAQNLDNPKGTKIRNKADIYFDYNSPITTNEVFNIIGDTIIAPPAPVVVYDCGLENPSVAQAGADLSLCEADQTTLNANVPTKGKGRWRIVSGQATIENPDSPTSAVRNIGYGETVLEWGITLCKKISASQIRINRYQIPAAPTVAALPLQCEGATLQPLVATGSNITWYQDAAKKHKLATGNRYTPTVAANATFYATQTLNGCESPVSAAAVTIHLKETTISVHADTLVTPAADSYQWYFNDKPLAGAQNQRLFVRNSGLYRVKTVTNGCEANSINVNHQVNLPEPKLKLYPNPVRGELLLEVASKATGEGRILVRNQLGKLVMELPAMKEYTVLEQKLNTSALASGMYFLEVFIGKEAHSLRFVKQ
ncbi:MAG: T9SS type A sorting domain-containing protein [Rufibacter sp.]